MIRITECPRDAMQGIRDFIPTELKVEYLQQLLRVGFERLDFGSFVSPKAIPQMKDSADVLKALDLKGTRTQLLAIIANVRGAEDACSHEKVSFLGFPFSISETFQQRNTNSSVAGSLERVKEIQRICQENGKKLLVYVSMAFGNPYNDPWSPEIAIDWTRKLADLGVEHLALADTTGSSTSDSIRHLFTALIPRLGNITMNAHLHSVPGQAGEKIRAAYESGCRAFDVAVHGFGGCPMAKDELTGNIATQELEKFSNTNKINLGIDIAELHKSYDLSWKIFNHYH